MTRRRTFTAQYKAQVVLDILSGQQSAADICRAHQLKLQVVSGWKTDFVNHAAQVFAQAETRSQEQQRIAELERVVEKLVIHLDRHVLLDSLRRRPICATIAADCNSLPTGQLA